jgi:hypothetical protein
LTARQIVPAVGVPARIDQLLLFSIHFSLTTESVDRQSGTRLASWGAFGTHRELLRFNRKRRSMMKKPKANPAGNTEKDPDDWVSGDEPMTGAQASYLKTLCEQAHSDAFDENLTKAQASKLIDEMREKAGVSDRDTRR